MWFFYGCTQNTQKKRNIVCKWREYIMWIKTVCIKTTWRNTYICVHYNKIIHKNWFVLSFGSTYSNIDPFYCKGTTGNILCITTGNPLNLFSESIFSVIRLRQSDLLFYLQHIFKHTHPLSRSLSRSNSPWNV